MSKKLIFTAFFVLFAMLLSPLSIAAAPAAPSLDGADSVYLFCEESGSVILSKSATKTIYPASMTKIMTGLVAIELIGNRLDEKVSLTSEMLVSKQGTSMSLKVGEVVSFRDLLYGSICGGFNDAAGALAVASAGSMPKFVERMNEKAKELGATSTHYTNPTGWHDDSMVTTLYDTALIARAASKDALYMTVSSAPTYTIPKNNISEEFIVRNRNGLIGSYYAAGYYNRHARGLAAGMTDEGGFCVATTAEYEGLNFLCIVMGGKHEGEEISSYRIANELLDYAIFYYGELDIVDKDDIISSLPVSLALSPNGKDSYMLDCVPKDDVSLFTVYDRGSLDTLEIKPYSYTDTLKAPIKEGEVVGGADVYIDGAYKGTFPLVASEDVRADAFLTFISSAKSFLLSRTFIISFISALILFGVYYFAVEIKIRRGRTKSLNYKNIY